MIALAAAEESGDESVATERRESTATMGDGEADAEAEAEVGGGEDDKTKEQKTVEALDKLLEEVNAKIRETQEERTSKLSVSVDLKQSRRQEEELVQFRDELTAIIVSTSASS